jgi:hypothetical protein
VFQKSFGILNTSKFLSQLDMKPYFNIMIEMTYENVKNDNLKTT